MPASFLLWLVIAQGRVAPAGTLATARTHHTATLLNDGQVLIVGGRSDGADALASTEFFDVKTNSWKPGPPLHVARAGHTATLLQDGSVLVVGGVSPSVADDGSSRLEALASVELFNRGKGQWTALAPLRGPRSGHTATLLPDGSVLVVGGTGPPYQPLSSVERLDRNGRTSSQVASLLTGRTMHQAVLLPNGDVLVLGGRISRTPDAGSTSTTVTDSVERWENTTETWHREAPLLEALQNSAAVRVESKVMVLGGLSVTTSTNSVEWWGPDSKRWESAERSLPVPITGHTATALHTGDVLVVGGEPPTSSADTGRVVRWHHSQDSWCLAGRLKTPRTRHSATLLKDGSVLIVGGTSAGLVENSAERWFPQKGACKEP